MRGFLALVLLAGISVGVFALSSLRSETDDKPLLHVAQEVPVTVAVDKPQRGEITRIAQAPGDVEAVLEVDISSEIVAKIVEMPVEEGDLVKEGDLLCRLDDTRLLAEVESAEERIAQLQAAIVQAEADVEKAERDCDRQMRLSEADATSRNEVLDYTTVRKKARASVKMRTHELAQAVAMLKRMREDLKRTIIESPIDGIIAKLNAKAGEVVITGTMNNPGTVIMTVTDLSRMQVRARVDEIEVPLVKSGQKARIYLQSESDKPVPASVLRVSSKGIKQLGRDVVIFEAILDVLSTEKHIMPGMTCNVEIEVATEPDAITIPVEAVVHRMRKELDDSIVAEYDKRQGSLDVSERARQAQYLKVVYVKDGEAAHVRLIEPGIADSRRVQVCSGLEMDETVIIGPYRSLDQLKDGKKVALAEEEKKEGAPGDEAKPEEGATDEQLAEDETGEADGDGSSKAGDSNDEPNNEQTVAASTTP